VSELIVQEFPILLLCFGDVIPLHFLRRIASSAPVSFFSLKRGLGTDDLSTDRSAAEGLHDLVEPIPYSILPISSDYLFNASLRRSAQ
jgi:hypothetical protein